MTICCFGFFDRHHPSSASAMAFGSTCKSANPSHRSSIIFPILSSPHTPLFPCASKISSRLSACQPAAPAPMSSIVLAAHPHVPEEASGFACRWPRPSFPLFRSACLTRFEKRSKNTIVRNQKRTRPKKGSLAIGATACSLCLKLCVARSCCHVSE